MLLFAHDKCRWKHLFLTFVVVRFISFLISLHHVTVTLGLFFCSLVCVHFLYSFFTFLLFIPISTFLLYRGKKILCFFVKIFIFPLSFFFNSLISFMLLLFLLLLMSFCLFLVLSHFTHQSRFSLKALKDENWLM